MYVGDFELLTLRNQLLRRFVATLYQYQWSYLYRRNHCRWNQQVQRSVTPQLIESVMVIKDNSKNISSIQDDKSYLNTL